MNLEDKKRLRDLLLILVLLALVFVFIEIKTDGARCVSDPKKYLLKHFEKLTDGNMTCTCLTDNPKAMTFTGRGYKILFTSFDYKD